MNRTLNQLINQLHLDPKKEAAVRKIVENAVSNNQNGGNSSSGSESVIIECLFGNAEAVTVTDEQINAAKNYNIKLKINYPDDDSRYIIAVPYCYYFEEEIISILIRVAIPTGNISDIGFSIDIINKTITVN